MVDPQALNEVPSPNAARLPGLGVPELSVDYLAKIKEIIEVLLGRRGQAFDRAVTFRDLQEGGALGALASAGISASPALFNPGTGQVVSGSGSFSFDESIRNSSAYQDLLTRIGSDNEFEDLPGEISRQIGDALIRVDNERRALATRVSRVAASLEALGGVELEERLTAIADDINGLKGQWTLKIQTDPANGQPPVIAGIALSAESPVAGPGTSTLVFLADKVGFYTSGGTLNPFSIVGNMVTMTNVRARSLRVEADDGSVILDARPLAQQVASNPNLVPSPLGWPTFYNGAYANRNANTVFNNGEYIGLAPLASAGAYVAAESPPCGLPAGATVTVSFDASCDSGTRLLQLNFYGPNVDTAQFQTTLNTTFKRYVWTITLPNVADAPKAYLRMWTSAVGSQIIISNVKVEQGSKATGWEDSIITGANAKNRVFIPYLSALSAFFGSVELGIGGALFAGPATFDSGAGFRLATDSNGDPYFVLRSNSGKYFRARPSTDTFESSGQRIINPDLVLATRTGSISSSPGTSFTHSRTVSGGYCGTHTAAINNAVNPAYSWSISSPYPQATFYLTGQAQAACSIYVTAKGAVAGDSVSATATCVMTDGGVSVVRTVDVFVDFT